MHKEKIALERNTNNKIDVINPKKLPVKQSGYTFKELDSKLKGYSEEYKTLLLKSEKKLDEINSQNTEILNIVSNKSTIVNHKIESVNNNCLDIHNDLIDLMAHLKPYKIDTYNILKEVYSECEHKYKNIAQV